MGQVQKVANELEKKRLKELLDYMRAVDIAVVISEEAVEEVLDCELPKNSYDIRVFRTTCDEVFDGIYKYAAESNK